MSTHHHGETNRKAYIARRALRRSLFARLAGLSLGSVLLRATCLAGVGLLGGCAISIPMASLIPKPHNDPTGSIAKPQLAGWLDKADWQHAKTAFSRALNAHQSGSTTTWANPTSGAKGSFAAVGEAYPGGSGGHCRAFLANIDRQAAVRSLEGTACADKSGAWQVTEVRPTKKT